MPGACSWRGERATAGAQGSARHADGRRAGDGRGDSMISNLEADLVTRHPVALAADPGRVIAKLFLPGE